LGGGGGTNPLGYNGGGGAGWLGNGGNGIGIGPGVQYGSGNGGFGPLSFAGGAGAGDSSIPQYATGGYGGGGGGGWQGGGGGGGYSGGGGGDGGGVSGNPGFGAGGGGSYANPSVTGLIATPGFNGVANGSGGAGENGWVDVGTLTFFYTGSLQTYVIPTTGDWFIEAVGAQGGSGEDSGDIGGYGAALSGYVYLTAGTRLDIVAGGAGLTGDFDSFFGGGGGGGSFVYTVPEPSTWAMIFLGFGGLGLLGYRKARRTLDAAVAA
jgi:hypothetical protein